ncbi:MAG TPA: sensor histidine kinase [Burkholderiales bacterium]|nr:sensor histidine kinase [Burkholderiales bacterium]
MRLKRYLLLYTTAIALPLLVFSSAVVFWTSELHRKSLQSEMQHTAYALGLAVELKIQGLHAATRAMSLSFDFDAGVPRSLYDRAQTLAARHLAWFALFDRSFAQLLNTRLPYSAALPPATNKEAIAQAFETRELVVSNLFFASGVRENVLSLYAPVLRDGKAQYVLAMTVDPRTISELLLEQPVPEGGYAFVMDGNGRVIAHSREHEKYLGTSVPVWLRNVSRRAGAVAEGISIDGALATVFIFHIPSTNWRLMLAVPSSSLTQLTWHPVFLLLLATIPVLLVSLLLASLFARRIEKAMASLVKSADAMLAPPSRQTLEALPIDELQILQAALERAAEAVQDSTRERDLRFAAESGQAAAEAASRAKDEVITTLSHELRSPLNAILGWMHMLRIKKGDEATVARGIDVMERNAKRLSRLIEDLLDMSRIVTGRLVPQKSSVDLSQLVAEVVEIHRVDAEAKHLSLDTELQNDVHLQADATRLYQVLVNLLVNAIKFTPVNGKIHITLRADQRHAFVTIQDTGIGIAPELLPKIFDRFWQADASSRAGKGLGLGLAIARHIVEAHGGTLRVSSDGLGEGTAFVVELPLNGE